MFKNKKIIVTGVSSGIGAETARQLKALGAIIIGVDRNEPKEALDSFHKVDLADETAIDIAVEVLRAERAHGLANIAGVPPTAPADLVLKVNLVGLKRLTLGLVSSLADEASIVNLASLAGRGWETEVEKIKAAEGLTHRDVFSFCAAHGINKDSSYFFTKQALVAWTLENRWTWRSRGIRMNAVSPGPVETPILGDFIETLGDRYQKNMQVMDRPANPGDIAPVVVFLLSGESAWLRGINIAADGGMSAYLDAASSGLS